MQVLTMQRGRYGNLTATAMKRSQFISPGLLRQQQVRRTYPNISSATAIQNNLNEDANISQTSARKTTNFINHSQVREGKVCYC